MLKTKERHYHLHQVIIWCERPAFQSAFILPDHSLSIKKVVVQSHAMNNAFYQPKRTCQKFTNPYNTRRCEGVISQMRRRAHGAKGFIALRNAVKFESISSFVCICDVL